MQVIKRPNIRTVTKRKWSSKVKAVWKSVKMETDENSLPKKMNINIINNPQHTVNSFNVCFLAD